MMDRIVNIVLQGCLQKIKKLLLNRGIMLVLLLHSRVTGSVLNLSFLSTARNIISK